MSNNYTATEVAIRQKEFNVRLTKIARIFEFRLNKMLAKTTLRTLTNYGSVTNAVCLRLKLK